MASFKAKFPVLQELFAKNHRGGPLGPPSGARVKSTVCRSSRFMLFLLTTHIRPLLEYCSCVWHTGFVQDLKLLENVQRRWTERIDGMGSLSYSDRLKALNLYSIQGRLLRADLITGCFIITVTRVFA